MANSNTADSNALVEDGLGLHRAEEGPAAERLYRQALDLDPDNAEPHHLIGVLRFQEGNPEEAVAAFERALVADAGNARYLANLGAALLVLGRIEDAVDALETAAGTASETPQLLMNFGTAYRQTNRTADAVAACEKAIAAFPDDADAFGSLAAALLSLGRVDEALAAAEKAVGITPQGADLLNTLGSVLIACGRLDDAIDTLERAVRLAPELNEGARNLAFVLQESRRYEEAAQRYLAIIDRWPDDAPAHAGLGRTRRLQGRLAEAIAACRQAVALNPSSPQALSNLLFCLIGSPDEDGLSLKAEHERWGARFAAGGSAPVHTNTRKPDRRLRIGAHDIDETALIFEGSAGYEQVLAAYGRVEIALDTFPYSGTMTTMEALWMGVPVVSLAGDRMIARQAVAHLTAAGLDEFIAGDLSDYRRLAVALAGDAARLESLRSTIRERLRTSELMDAPGLARALEDAWRGMWRRWCAAADPVD